MTMQQLETNGASSNPIPGLDAETAQAVRLMEIAMELVAKGATIGAFVIPPFSKSSGFSIEQWLSQAIGTAFPLFEQPPNVAIGYICDAIRVSDETLDERDTALVRINELQLCGRTLSKAENEELITLQRITKNAAAAFEKEHGDANKKARRDSFWKYDVGVTGHGTDGNDTRSEAQRELETMLDEFLSSSVIERPISGVSELMRTLLAMLEVQDGEYVRFDRVSSGVTVAYGKTPQPLEPFGGLANGTMFFQSAASDARHHWSGDTVSGRDAIASWCGADAAEYVSTTHPNLMQAMKRRIRDAMAELGLEECNAAWNGQRNDTDRYPGDNYNALRIQYRTPDGQKRDYLSKWLYTGTKLDSGYSLSKIFN